MPQSLSLLQGSAGVQRFALQKLSLSQSVSLLQSARPPAVPPLLEALAPPVAEPVLPEPPLLEPPLEDALPPEATWPKLDPPLASQLPSSLPSCVSMLQPEVAVMMKAKPTSDKNLNACIFMDPPTLLTERT